MEKNTKPDLSDTPPSQLALTYFAHKVADQWSIHKSLIYGTKLGDLEDKHSVDTHYVPKFTPPYKQTN